MPFCHPHLLLPGGDAAVLVGASGPRTTLILQRMVEEREPRAWHPGDGVTPILVLDHLYTDSFHKRGKQTPALIQSCYVCALLVLLVLSSYKSQKLPLRSSLSC